MEKNELADRVRKMMEPVKTTPEVYEDLEVDGVPIRIPKGWSAVVLTGRGRGGKEARDD